MQGFSKKAMCLTNWGCHNFGWLIDWLNALSVLTNTHNLIMQEGNASAAAFCFVRFGCQRSILCGWLATNRRYLSRMPMFAT
jgi:hypothetical protein